MAADAYRAFTETGGAKDLTHLRGAKLPGARGKVNPIQARDGRNVGTAVEQQLRAKTVWAVRPAGTGTQNAHTVLGQGEKLIRLQRLFTQLNIVNGFCSPAAQIGQEPQPADPPRVQWVGRDSGC